MKKLLFLVFLLAAGVSIPAFACPDGQYEQCAQACAFGGCVKAGCICVPNSGTVFKSATKAAGAAANPLPDLLNVAGAVVHGNVNELSNAIGGAIVNSCIACGTVANIYVSPEDRPFIEEIIGRGFIIFVTTEDPYLVVADAATSVAMRVALKQPPPPIPLPIPTPDPAAQPITWETSAADCIFSNKDAYVAGWIAPPVLTNKKTNEKFTFPNVGIGEKDTVTVTSTNAGCPQPKQGLVPNQKYVTKAEFSGINSATHAGKPSEMHYFLFTK